MALSTVDATIPSPAPVTGSRELSRIAAELVDKPSLWWPHVRYKRSARFYTRVSAGDTFEAWLLTWLPGQSTGLHDHGGSSGAFVVVKGVLTETTVSPDGAYGSSATSPTRAYERLAKPTSTMSRTAAASPRSACTSTRQP